MRSRLGPMSPSLSDGGGLTTGCAVLIFLASTSAQDLDFLFLLFFALDFFNLRFLLRSSPDESEDVELELALELSDESEESDESSELVESRLLRFFDLECFLLFFWSFVFCLELFLFRLFPLFFSLKEALPFESFLEYSCSLLFLLARRSIVVLVFKSNKITNEMLRCHQSTLEKTSPQYCHQRAMYRERKNCFQAWLSYELSFFYSTLTFRRTKY